MADFPIVVVPVGDDRVALHGPGFKVVMCAHGARALADALRQVAYLQHCPCLHRNDSTMFVSAESTELREAPQRPVKATRWRSR